PDGAQADGRFFVWAERLPAGRRGPRPGRRPKEGAPHPFQARPEEVRDAIVALAPSLASPFERTPWRLARHNIRLPSSATGPIPSPDAARLAAALSENGIGELPAGGQPVLGVWQVRGVALEAVRAIRLLTS